MPFSFLHYKFDNEIKVHTRNFLFYPPFAAKLLVYIIIIIMCIMIYLVFINMLATTKRSPVMHSYMASSLNVIGLVFVLNLHYAVCWTFQAQP